MTKSAVTTSSEPRMVTRKNRLRTIGIFRWTNFAQDPCGHMTRGQNGQSAVRVFRRNHTDHANSHVEGLLHLFPFDPTAVGDCREDRRWRPGSPFEIRLQATRNYPGEVGR